MTKVIMPPATTTDPGRSAGIGRLCRLCNSPDNHLLHHQPESKYFPRDIYECKHCGYAFVDPPPSREQLAAVYADPAYFDRGVAVDAQALFNNPRVSRRIIDRLHWFDRLGIKGRLLDVGCHYGEFLHHALQHGWEAHGVDLSAYAVEIASQLTGAQVFNQELREIEKTGQKYDLVTLWEVIEHVTDPDIFIEDCARILTPGGQIALSTPNQRNHNALFKGRNWKGYFSGQEHLHFFNPAPLRKLLENHGIEVVATRTRRIAPFLLRWMAPLGFGSELEMVGKLPE